MKLKWMETILRVNSKVVRSFDCDSCHHKVTAIYMLLRSLGFRWLLAICSITQQQQLFVLCVKNTAHNLVNLIFNNQSEPYCRGLSNKKFLLSLKLDQTIICRDLLISPNIAIFCLVMNHQFISNKEETIAVCFVWICNDIINQFFFHWRYVIDGLP
mmetsp:Transcript_3448/g.7274  ORF Transcript_3448/g.7274 Transcript_3448/m.7274 type:complete len:157 (-) Transcript_3448:445-915(-)